MNRYSNSGVRVGLVIVSVLLTYGFFSSFGPFSDNGTIVKENIFLACLLLGFTIFTVSNFVISGFFNMKLPQILSGIIAFSVVEFLLLGSLSLLNGWAIVAAISFNGLLYWYLLRRFNR